MTKYIFHGGGATDENEQNDSFFHEVVKEASTILLVYFASRSNDNSEKIEQDTLKFKKADGKDLKFVIATHEDFLTQVAYADAIFLRGGSTQKLLDALKMYPNLKECFKGKTVAGSSAGAYVLSTYYSSHYEDAVAEGLGLVPVRVVTHYQSKKMPPKEGAVEALKNTATELQLIILKEGEWQVVYA